VNLTTKVKLAGKYRLEVRKAKDGSLRQELEFDNLIVDQGMNLFSRSTGSTSLPWAMVGTGTTTPTVNDTQLANRVASSGGSTSTNIVNQTTGTSTSEPYYGFYRLTYRFVPGSLNNVNLTEVGVGTTTTSVFSRALIVDGNGDPTSITVLSDEFLDVTYELRLYPFVDDQTDTITITNVGTINVTRRPIAVTAVTATGGWVPGLSSTAGLSIPRGFISNATSNSWVRVSGAQTALVAKTNAWTSVSTLAVTSSSVSYSAYVAGSFEQDLTYILGLDAGNTSGGIRYFQFALDGLGAYQYLFSDLIAKNNTNTLRFNMKAVWSRY
jgi:hypothetical protein